MFKLPKIVVLFTITLFLFSCKNDLKLSAPYREIPSIYAVLSGQDKIHMIRVNKVFLGDGDANAMAKVADSINYPAGELYITLERFAKGSSYASQIDACPTCTDNPNTAVNEKRTIVFRDSVLTSADGAFSRTQRVYVSSSDLHEALPTIDPTTSLNTNPNWKVSGDYLLTVKNVRTGNVFTAKSTIVDSIRPYQPGTFKPFGPPYYPYPDGWGSGGVDQVNDFVDYTVNDATYQVRFIPNDAQTYQLIMRYHFRDDPGSINRSVDYVTNNLDATRDKRNTQVGSYMVTEFKGRDVYSAIGVGLSKSGLNDQLIGRKMYMIEYLVYSSTQDYVDYMEFVKPSLNVSQNKPLYSNFTDRAALGIFTFKGRCSIKKEISAPFVNSFSDNPNTCRFKFLTFAGALRGCK